MPSTTSVDLARRRPCCTGRRCHRRSSTVDAVGIGRTEPVGGRGPTTGCGRARSSARERSPRPALVLGRHAEVHGLGPLEHVRARRDEEAAVVLVVALAAPELCPVERRDRSGRRHREPVSEVACRLGQRDLEGRVVDRRQAGDLVGFAVCRSRRIPRSRSSRTSSPRRSPSDSPCASSAVMKSLAVIATSSNGGA